MGSKNKSKENSDSGKNQKSMGKSGGEIITDPRFSSANWDPKFREAPKYKTKVKLDSRFTKVISRNKHFASSKAPVDKRGRPKERRDSAVDSLKRYYRLEEEGKKKKKDLRKSEDSDESEGEKGKSEDLGKDEETSGSESEESEGEIFVNKDKLNLEVKSESEASDSGFEEEEEEVSDDSSTSTADTGHDEAFEEDEDTFVQEENIPEIDNETHRLAVVNMDWSQVKAADLFMVLSSFLPKNGQIKSVAVYPSEFGLKRMEEEAVHGPVGLFDDDKKKNDDDDDSEDDDSDDEIDKEKLRAYELSRLRYYYAVVECDSIATADHLYKNCDGIEFERSSVKLDLRFIPDSMEFKHQPRDVATEAPADYDGLDFHNRALQHSNIDLTWDDDEPHRTKTLKRKFNADQLAELEFKEFLASDESGSDDSENDDTMEGPSAKKQKKQDLYRALLLSEDRSDKSDEDENQDMEVTFNTGLEDLSKRILGKKDAKSESVWEAYLRKRREKKKARKNRSKNSSEDESSETDIEAAEEHDDFFEEESVGKGSKQTRSKATRIEKSNQEKAQDSEASRAELELLLADDKGTKSNLKGYNLKRKKMKGKIGNETPDEEKLPSIDYDDNRFSALFTSPLFALDPTEPQFKRSAVYARQLAQKQQNAGKETMGSKEQSEINGQSAMSAELQGDENNDSLTGVPKKEKHELSSLVKSVKMKSKQLAYQGKPLERGSKGKLIKAIKGTK